MVEDLPAVAALYEPTSYPTFAIAAAARGVCRLVWVVDLADARLASRQRMLRRFGALVDVHGRSGSDVTSELASLGVRGIITFTDPPIRYAAAIADEMCLPFHSPTVATLVSDKWEQRRALRDHGVPSAAFQLVPAGSRAPQGVAFPAVVKPRHGANARDVSRVDDQHGLRRALAASAHEDMLVEQFLPYRTPRAEQKHYADLVSVETVVRHGEPTHLGVTRRWPFDPPLRESGSFVPDLTTGAARQEILDVATAAVAALGIRHSFLHIEIKVTPTGPHVVEVNGRLAGVVPELTLLAGGCDLLRQAFLLALDQPLDEPVQPERVGYLIWGHPPVGARSVRAVEGLDAVRRLPGVADVRLNRPPGSPVDWREGALGHVYAVEGSAPDHASAFALREGVLRSVTVTYD
ncbi:MAG: ATP-grasp domain-containing protein [Mycobacteriales bacterium]